MSSRTSLKRFRSPLSSLTTRCSPPGWHHRLAMPQLLKSSMEHRLETLALLKRLGGGKKQNWRCYGRRCACSSTGSRSSISNYKIPRNLD